MKLQVKLDLTDAQFSKLWIKGTGHLLREDPRKAYSLKEKKEAVRATVLLLVGKFLEERS